MLRSVSRFITHHTDSLNRYTRALGLALPSPNPWMRYMRMVTMKDATWRTWWGSRTDVCPYSPGDYYRPSPGLVGMDEALYSNLLSFLPGDILVKVDRTATIVR